jgi:multidrug resistance efflux pump
MEETEMDVSRLNTVLSRIQELQKAILDKKANLERCEIRSPTDGIVIANQRFSGERIAAADALVEILEKDSLEAVVYFPRDRAQQIKLGETVALAVGRHRTPIAGVVCRIEDPAGPPPSSIRRFYQAGQDLKAVHLKPSLPPGAELELRLGSIVKVPNRRRSSLAGTPCPTPDVSAADFDHDGEHQP